MSDLVSRRKLLAKVGGCTAIMLAGCTGGGSSGAGGGVSWQHDETVTSDGGVIHEFFGGELEKGDEIETEVVVNRGRQARFEMLNNDTGEFYHTKYVWRSEDMEGYDSENERWTVSPYRETLEIPEFGEYYARVLTPSDGMEVEFRFRSV